MAGRPPVPLCVASADPVVRRHAAELLSGQGYLVLEADALSELVRLASEVVAAVVVDPRLPGLEVAPLSRLRAEPALHSRAILLLTDEELAGLSSPPPAPSLVGLMLRVHGQIAGDQQLELLRDVGHQVTASPDLESTMRATVEAAAERLEIDTATLFMLNEDGDIEARASWGYELETARLRRIPAGEGVVGWVIAWRQPTIVGDSDLDARFASLDGRSSRSMLAVPILVGHRVLGALTLVRRTPRPQFTDTDLVLVGTIANSAGIALENARLYEEEQALVRQLAEADRLVGEERRLLAEIEKWESLYTQVVATVSHELKTPLMGIRGFARMLRDDELDPAEARDFAGEIHDNAMRLSRYVEGILAEDAVHSGRMVVECKPVDLRPLVEQVVRTITPMLRPVHRLAVEIDGGVPPVRGDADKLLQVLTNLVSNAVKYSPDGGRVLLVASHVGENVELCVEDEGLGIPEDARERVFERFYRVPAQRDRGISGTGLGLSIVRGIVELHGGGIRIESGSGGRGTRFVVSLPAVVGAVAQPATVAATPIPLRPRKRSRAGLSARLVEGAASGAGRRAAAAVADDDVIAEVS